MMKLIKSCENYKMQVVDILTNLTEDCKAKFPNQRCTQIIEYRMMEIAEMDCDLLRQGWNTMMIALKLHTNKIELHTAYEHERVSYQTSITGVMLTYDAITNILWEDFTIPSPSDENLIYPYAKFNIPKLLYII